MAHKSKPKHRSKQSLSTGSIRAILTRAREASQKELWAEASALYAQALPCLRQCDRRIRRDYAAAWLEFAGLQIRNDEFEKARSLYEEYLSEAILDARFEDAERAIAAYRAVATLTNPLDLVSIFKKLQGARVLAQVPVAIVKQVFDQAIAAYEKDRSSSTMQLISQLSALFKQSAETGVKTVNEISNDLKDWDLQAIYSERTHGVVMYRGAGYGIRTAMLYVLGMLNDTEGIEKVVLEGIEDFDVHYDPSMTQLLETAASQRTYIQAKSRDAGQRPWSVDQMRDVFNSFARVYCADPEANFLFVTDYHFGEQASLSGVLEYSDLWGYDKDHSVRVSIANVLESTYTEHLRFDMDEFLHRIRFRRVERVLESPLIDKIAKWLDCPIAVASVYYSELLRVLYNLAEASKEKGERKELSKPEPGAASP